LKNSGSIDWTALKRYASAQGIKDFDAFLDALPLNVGYNALIAAGIAWLLAGTAVFFTAMQVESVSKIRTELAKIEALKPPVPVLQYSPVPEAQLVDFQKKISATYKGIVFTGTASALTVSAPDTDYFPQFIAALNTLQNGGRNWRAGISTMCVGRDCVNSKMSAVVKVEFARIGEPPAQTEAAEETQ
jgi:hypothetical protein